MNKIIINRHKKAYEISKFWIEKIGLNLSGFNVLTEVGSNGYTYLPLIASLAGAKNVFAWCKDTSYGIASDMVLEAMKAEDVWGISDTIIYRLNDRRFEDIVNADLITNSGMIRPLDSKFIKNVRSSTVISLMFESWELRMDDIDLAECENNNVTVTGVSEKNSIMNIFEYTGVLAVKLLLSSNIEIYNSNILVWSNDEFGQVAYNWLKKLNPKSIIISNDINRFYDILEQIDVIYICDYHEERNYFGEAGFMDIKKVVKLNSKLVICHLYGNISLQECNINGLEIYPQKSGKAKTMSESLAHVGLEPILQLMIAGLKAGQEVLRSESFNFAQKIV
jgi:hypothetical protein